jgi:bacillithiol system protein YtxJ
MSPLQPLSHVDELEAAIAESSDRPVLLFKHSRSCGISCEALDELRAHVDGADCGAVYKVITVQSHRHVSNEAATRLGIRHETPQVILLRNGRPVWSASHFRITKDQLDDVLQRSVGGSAVVGRGL